MARQNGWFVKRDKTTWSRPTASSKAPRIPGPEQGSHLRGRGPLLRAYYLRPKPILRIIKTMLETRRPDPPLPRGYEFFKSLQQRKEDLAAARSVASTPSMRERNVTLNGASAAAEVRRISSMCQISPICVLRFSLLPGPPWRPQFSKLACVARHASL